MIFSMILLQHKRLMELERHIKKASVKIIPSDLKI